MTCAKKQNLPIVIDADGLFILSTDTSIIKGYEKCILTPNLMEFKRIYEFEVIQNNIQKFILKLKKNNCSKFKNEGEYDETKNFSTLNLQCEAVKKLAQKLENVTIIKKGNVDIISDGRDVLLNDAEGMPKRCGGIGDLLSGAIGTFTYWCNTNKDATNNLNQNSNMIACYAAGVLIKECSKFAFTKYHRAVLAVDIIEQIAEIFYEMFDK